MCKSRYYFAQPNHWAWAATFSFKRYWAQNILSQWLFSVCPYLVAYWPGWQLLLFILANEHNEMRSCPTQPINIWYGCVPPSAQLTKGYVLNTISNRNKCSMSNSLHFYCLSFPLSQYLINLLRLTALWKTYQPHFSSQTHQSVSSPCLGCIVFIHKRQKACCEMAYNLL